MAEIETRGYVKNPQNKTANGKSFCTFGLNCKQKGYKDRPDTYAFFNVTDWKNSVAPEEGSYATVKGWFTVREYQKDGVTKQALDINAQSINVAEKNGTTAAVTPSPEKDPWES